ncbi:uncharacterized protein [Solanum lycopersicum]|uniref:uncharacterized protein n=1 Tax=Solanum lycopersicum TaxID=4081 RepID=UPI0008FECA10|nr:uncharacterized protein LOC109120456 [Solanum lycopersicum]
MTNETVEQSSGNGRTTNGTGSEEVNSAMYMHPSDNPECKKPDPGTLQYRQWEMCDDIVTSWILNSLAKEIFDGVEYVSDSFELWKELEDRYDQTNGAKLYQVQREINDLSQGILDITTYYTRMKRLWEELRTLHKKIQCSCNCVCGAKENFYKAEQDRRLIHVPYGIE